MATTKKFVLTIGTNSFVMNLPTYYDGIEQHLGMREATDADNNLPPMTTKGLLKSGLGVTLTISRKLATTNKYVRNKLVVPIAHLSKAIIQLEGKTFTTGTGAKAKSGEIVSVYFSQRRRLG